MSEKLEYRVEQLEKGAERREAKLDEITGSVIRSEERYQRILSDTGAISKELAALAREMREKPNRDFSSERTPLPGVVTETQPSQPPQNVDGVGSSIKEVVLSLKEVPIAAWLTVIFVVGIMGGVVTPTVFQGVFEGIMGRPLGEMPAIESIP